MDIRALLAQSTFAQNSCFIVTGAAGHLGSTVLRLLAGTGIEVRGLLLPGETPPVTAANIRYYTGDVCDADSLRCLFTDTHGKPCVVIHTAALISIAEKMPPRLYAVNVGGVRNVLRLCREYGAARLVHVSSVHAIPELPAGQVMTEPASFAAQRVHGGYAKTKAEAAQAVLDAAAAGLNAVVVFPSGILGPYDTGRNHLVQMVKSAMQGRLPACVKGGYDFVDVRDVAAGCLLAALRGRAGEGYILSGHYFTICRLLALVRQSCGGRSVPVLPRWMAEAAVPFIACRAALRRERPLYTRYSLRTLQVNSLFSSAKAARELGYTARPLAETVADMAAWLKAQTGADSIPAAPVQRAKKQRARPARSLN